MFCTRQIRQFKQLLLLIQDEELLFPWHAISWDQGPEQGNHQRLLLWLPWCWRRALSQVQAQHPASGIPAALHGHRGSASLDVPTLELLQIETKGFTLSARTLSNR